MNWLNNFFQKVFADLTLVDASLVLLATIIIAGIMMIDAFSLTAGKKKEASGLDKNTSTISIDGGKQLPVREYVSEIQGLAGKPDALISEGGNIIPVERKPLAKKIRDRYVAQLLVYMRLVEEFEGKKPPYGYLILGPKCRKIKIYNSEEKQAWLSKVLEDMRAILKGQTAQANPHLKKCRGCEVETSCKFSALKNSDSLTN